MSSLPNISTTKDDTDGKIADIWAARLAFCDSPTYDTCQIARASGTILLFLIAILPHLATFPCTWRLCRRYSTAFYILLYINILHSINLVLYAVPAMEYLAGTRFIKVFPVETFLLFFFGTSMARIYILLAFNRVMAIFSLFAYNRVFSRAYLNVYLALIFFTSLGSCIFAFYFPETRYHSCLATINMETPFAYANEHSPSIVAAVMTHWAIVGLITGFGPILVYALALVKLFIDPYSSSGSSSSAAGGVSAGISSSSAHLHHIYQNQSRELWPLYAICLLGTAPYFMINCLSILRSHKILGQQATAINELLAWLYNAQQPWLMLLLSRDMRAELRVDVKRVCRWIRRCCTTKSNSVQPMPPLGIVVVTNLQQN